MSTVPDTIERAITVKATQERVFAAISDPKQLVQWFPDRVDGSFEPGSQPVFTFEGHGKNRVLVVDSRPFEYFAFRWVPGNTEVVDDVTEVPTTLVEFMIEGSGSETTVTMKESGFASLPAEVIEKKFQMNSGGWEYMMGRLEAFLS